MDTADYAESPVGHSHDRSAARPLIRHSPVYGIAPEIVACQLVDSGGFGRFLDNLAEHFGVMP